MTRQIDDVNGLLYMIARVLAHASLFNDDDLMRLRAGLLEMAREADDDNDALVCRALSTAFGIYMETDDAAD